MKKLYFILLLVLSCHYAFTQEVKFKLTAAANFPIIRNEKAAYTSNNYKTSSSTNFSEKAGYKLGGSVLIKVKDRFWAETGVQANRIRFQKSHTWTVTTITKMPSMPGTSDPMDADFWNPFIPPQPSKQAAAGPEPTPATSAILYIELPQTVRYTLNNLIQLKAGFTTSLLADSRQYHFLANPNGGSTTSETKTVTTSNGTATYLYQETNKMQGGSYQKGTSGNGLSKALFSLNTGVAFLASENLAIELDYDRYLTPLYESSAAKQKYNLFNLGTSFTF